MIQTKNLGKKFLDEWVFRNLNFDLKKSETISLIGISGSGKSVLLKILASLLQPDEGEYKIATQKIGMVFQKNALLDSISIEENLRLAVFQENLSEAEFQEKSDYYLNKVELKNIKNLFPHQLSGGMQKRVGLARALMTEPELLLLDDPTAGLDPMTSKSIILLIRKINEAKRLTSLVITNDLPRAFELSHQSLLLTKSELIPITSPEELFFSKIPQVAEFGASYRFSAKEKFQKK